MTRYAFLDRHLPSLAPALGWWLDGLARFGGAMVAPPARVSRLRMNADGTLTQAPKRRRAEAALVIPDADWLTLDRALPPVGTEARRGIVALEVSDRTPFAATDVWTGWGEGAVHVVRRAITAAAIQQAQNAGTTIRWLVPETTPAGAVIDLTPPMDTPFRGAALVGLGGALAVAIFAGLIWSDLRDLSQTRAAMDATLADSLATAAEAATLRTRVQALQNASASDLPDALLPNRPPVHVLLEDVTRAVPDNSYLTRLEVDATALRLRGISGSPEALVRNLDQAPAFTGVAFDGPVTRDAAGTRFGITMQIVGATP